MKCPKCSSKTSVIDSRGIDSNKILVREVHYIYRRRRCKSCGYTFTTGEAPIESLAHVKRVNDSISMAIFKLRTSLKNLESLIDEPE